MEQIKQLIKDKFNQCSDKELLLNELKEFLHREISEIKQPISDFFWMKYFNKAV